MAGMRLVPANFGPMKGANAQARFTGPCGDTMEFWLRIMDGRVVQATYTSDGCQHSISCGSATATLSLGKGQSALAGITSEDVFEAVATLPEGHRHCTRLAVKTLKLAADSYWGAGTTVGSGVAAESDSGSSGGSQASNLDTDSFTKE